MYPPPHLGLECAIEEKRSAVKLCYVHGVTVEHANAELIDVLQLFRQGRFHLPLQLITLPRPYRFHPLIILPQNACMYVCMYIERERERAASMYIERDMDVRTYICMYIHIYITSFEMEK
jgi:hypothetical protein